MAATKKPPFAAASWTARRLAARAYPTVPADDRGRRRAGSKPVPADDRTRHLCHRAIPDERAVRCRDLCLREARTGRNQARRAGCITHGHHDCHRLPASVYRLIRAGSNDENVRGTRSRPKPRHDRGRPAGDPAGDGNRRDEDETTPGQATGHTTRLDASAPASFHRKRDLSRRNSRRGE